MHASCHFSHLVFRIFKYSLLFGCFSKCSVSSDSLWMELREAGLGAYVDLLKAEEVDKATFVALTNDDLMHLGIINTLHRQTLLKIAKAVRHM